MTKDKQRKQAARGRARRTGEPYSLAARRAGKGSGVVLAADLQAALADTLREQGWMVGQQDFVDMGEYTSYAGAAQISVGRDEVFTGLFAGPEDPDDEDLDLSVPPTVEVRWPYLDEMDAESTARADFTLAGDLPVGQIVAEINRRLSEARTAAVRDTKADAECSICGDSYAKRHLVYTDSRVCPSCVFDGDLLAALDPFMFAAVYDHSMSTDSALPPLWTAIAVLVACVLPSPDSVQENWPADPWVALEHWSDPRSFTLWLPPKEQRIAALQGLGAAASVGAIMDAIDRAHPNLRESLLRERAEERETDESEAEKLAYAKRKFVTQVWPAVVAYVVAAATQQAERPDQRGPWHFTESFEESHIEVLIENTGSSLDWFDTMMTLLYTSSLERALGMKVRI